MTQSVQHSFLDADSSDDLIAVAVPVPLRTVFTYRVPKSIHAPVQPGVRVVVPFGSRNVVGVALEHLNEDNTDTGSDRRIRIKSIKKVLDTAPVISPELLSFLREAARYYYHPLGEVLRAALPALTRKDLSSLRDQGLLKESDKVRGAKVSVPLQLWATRTSASAESFRLGAVQKAVLACLESAKQDQAYAEVSLDRLRSVAKNPRGTLRALEKHGLVKLLEKERQDPFFSHPAKRDVPPTLNKEQQSAVDTLVSSLDTPKRAFLLHGVTGSGKTEVYLHVIERARELGKSALLLVPEIALTPQLVGRFRARFGDDIAVLHSELAPKDRYRMWQGLHSGKYPLAIGARSAIFAPIPNLGVVVVDEEHDPSFKQEEGFRYHGRDLALLRAQKAGATCILGSATPSLEMYRLAEANRLKLLQLQKRAAERPLPSVEIIDLRRHKSTPSGHALLTQPLHRAIERCLSSEGQAILFLNRRGYAPTVRCQSCGEVANCPACSIALTEHRHRNLRCCHYCGFQQSTQSGCRSCGTQDWASFGLGTEQLESTLQEVFPAARVARLDRDTASAQGAEAVLEKLRNQQLDILVGTQMVTKGHDLPGVTLVGVVLAEQSLFFPDFRATERTFQLLSQVAGRAGRGDKPGEVYLQTYQPEHPVLKFAQQHDYRGFAQHEITEREELEYPPFVKAAAVRIDAGSEAHAQQAAQMLAEVARNSESVQRGQVRILGPAAAPIARLRGRFRYRLLLFAEQRLDLREVLSSLTLRIDAGIAPARAILDVDPVSML